MVKPCDECRNRVNRLYIRRGQIPSAGSVPAKSVLHSGAESLDLAEDTMLRYRTHGHTYPDLDGLQPILDSLSWWISKIARYQSIILVPQGRDGCSFSQRIGILLLRFRDARGWKHTKVIDKKNVGSYVDITTIIDDVRRFILPVTFPSV